MLLTTGLGLGCIGFAGYNFVKQVRDPTRELLKKALYEAQLYNEHRKQDGKKVIQFCKVTAFYKEDFGYDITLKLPVGLTVTKIREHLEVLEMALDAEIKLEGKGQYVRLSVGQIELERHMNYRDGLVKQKSGLHIPLFTRFGIDTIDFDSEMGANVLIGGPPGMGKSKLLDLIMTLIIVQTNGKSQIQLINNKRVDTKPYENLPCVTIHESLKESELALQTAIDELEARKQKLIEAGVAKASELDEYLPPYFVVIDEYASFCDEKSFQSKVMEIAERGRSFDIHLVIATQRPDAAEVLNPRIKACCMTKVAFKTTTASNSRVIIETDDAYKLPEIQGRAILQKSGNKQIQVPFLSNEQRFVLLQPYYQKAGDDDHDPTGSDDPHVPGKVSRIKPRSNRSTGLQRYRESRKDRE